MSIKAHAGQFGEIQFLSVWDKNTQSFKPWWSYAIRINDHEWCLNLSQWTLKENIQTQFRRFILSFYTTTYYLPPNNPLKDPGFRLSNPGENPPMDNLSKQRPFRSRFGRVSARSILRCFQGLIADELQDLPKEDVGPGLPSPKNLPETSPWNHGSQWKMGFSQYETRILSS